jgi:hypothetical protein
VGDYKQPVSGATSSVGFTTRLVTISAITPDGQTAITVDQAGVEARVPMGIQRAKGALPAVGEQWIISQDISDTWSFAAIASTTAAPFINPSASNGSSGGGEVATLPITGTDIAFQTITGLNLAAAASGTNLILDPGFAVPAINATRLADAGTAGTWAITAPNARASGAALATLALMPSALVPLYVNPGEQYYLSVGVTVSGGSGVTGGIQFAYNGGSFGGPDLPLAAGPNTIAQLVTIPAGVFSAYVRIIVSGLAGAATATFTTPICYITQGPNQMQAGSVTNSAIALGAVQANSLAVGAVTANAIAANAVDASKIVANTITVAQLQAGIVVAGIVDSTVVTGATIQNSLGNPKTSINPDGSITITNAAANVIFKIGPDGTVYWYASSGVLLQEIEPGGTQLVYQSNTGPAGCDFEPPQPFVLFDTTSIVSAASYANTVGAAVPAGAVVTVVASCNSATVVATGVTDSKGNSYSLVQSQSSSIPTMQVFESVNLATPLTITDTITIAYSATNTLGKGMIAIATVGVAAAPLDYSAQAAGTSTAPSVSGTPTAYADTVLMIIANSGTAGPSAVPDPWQVVGQTTAAGSQTTSLYYSANLASSGSFAASATLPSSVGWSAVTLGYLASPATPFTPNAPVPLNASVSPSSVWSDDGNFSCKVTKVGTAASWGLNFPPFPVQASGAVAMRFICSTVPPAVALPLADWGFTFFSGPNGTGTNLGSASFGGFNLSTNVFWILSYNTTVPAGAVSAIAWITEAQADTAGNYFLVDNLDIPGGLVYSNSPVATTDSYGNLVDQGINFAGLPGLTNVFGIEDPYKGTQLASIDGSGNIQAQSLSTASDLLIAGQSLLNDILPPYPLGLVNYGFLSVSAGWPSTPIAGTEIALFELDQTVVANRVYEFVMNPSIINASAAGSMHVRLRYTTDGSTPSTSSAMAHEVACRVETSGTDAQLGPLRCVFFPTAAGTYRFLVTGVGSAGFQFKNDPFIRCQVYDWGTNNGVSNNNLSVLGSGGGGGNSPQNYVEYFNASNTWAFWEYGQRNKNSTIYQGAYSGEGYAQHAWIQWGFGSLGNGLSTVLNYTVQQVRIRLSNQHSWYNSGATVSFHSASGAAPNQALNGVSSELQNWHINEGQTLWTTLGSSAWSPYKAGGTTYTVLHPPSSSLSLNYYSYYAGANGSASNIPQLAVYYSH